MRKGTENAHTAADMYDSPTLMWPTRMMQIRLFCVAARRRGRPNIDCVAGSFRFGFAVCDLLYLLVVAVESYRGEGVQVIKRAAVGFVFEDVGNAAEVIGGVCGIVPRRAAEGDVEGYVLVIGRV